MEATAAIVVMLVVILYATPPKLGDLIRHDPCDLVSASDAVFANSIKITETACRQCMKDEDEDNVESDDDYDVDEDGDDDKGDYDDGDLQVCA